MRSIKAILAVVAAMALMSALAMPAFAHARFDGCCDFHDGGIHNFVFNDDDCCDFDHGFHNFLGFNRFGCCDHDFFDDDIFEDENDCNLHQVLDLNTNQWVWVC